ncbi:MAG: hypothetical protein EA392_00950 [Cryomorphaceae bacterium]|nr:MAG: hypothetical protein EA392_00950 [Cryomorphaceae bacterium]
MSQQTTKVHIDADNRKLKRGLKDSEKEVKGFGGKIDGLGKKLGMLAGAAAIGAVVKGLFNMAKQLGQTADRLLDLEQITGTSTDALQEWEHVARIAGVNAETYSNAVIGLTQRLARGAEMSAGLRMGIERLGIEMKNQNGTMRSGAEITEEAITKLAEMDDITQRNIAGAQLFSGAWKDLAPILALGADGIEAAKNEARELGLVMDREALEKANAFRVEMEKVSAQFGRFKQDVGMLVIPAILGIVNVLQRAVAGYKNLLGLMGSVTDQALGTPQKQVDDFIASIDSIIDREQRRAAIVEEIIYLQNKSRELWREEDKALQEIGNSMAEQAKILQKNYDVYVDLKAKEIAEAEKAAEAQRMAEEQAEQQRRDALGEIGRLQEDIGNLEKRIIAANTEAIREKYAIEKALLQEKLDLIKQTISAEGLGAAEADRRGLTGISPMAPRGVQLDDGHQDFLDQQKEKEIALKGVSKQAQETGDALINMEQFAVDAAYEAGIAMGQMAKAGGQATSDIIKQMMAQTIAALIRHIMTQVPFPANIGLAAGAGVMASGLFNQIPAYASGTSNHPGGLAWVGERGPELAELPKGTAVHSHRDSMAMMGGQGGKVEFEIRGDKLLGVLRRYTNRLTSNT